MPKNSFRVAPLASVIATPTLDVEGVTLHVLPCLPASPFQTVSDDARTGTQYVYDVETLRASLDPTRPLPLDIEHNTETGAEDTRARGWLRGLATAEEHPSLALTPGVLYALVELNDLGLSEQAQKLYGYTSAVVLGDYAEDGTYVITSLKSLARTNNPATSMPVSLTLKSGARNASYTEHQNSFSSEEMLEQLIQILGLEGADEAAVIAAVQALVDASAAASAAAEAAAAAAPSAAPAAAADDVSALTARVDALSTAVAALTQKASAFSASLSKQVTPAKPTTAADKAGVSTAAFAKAQAILAARGRTI